MVMEAVALKVHKEDEAMAIKAAAEQRRKEFKQNREHLKQHQ